MYSFLVVGGSSQSENHQKRQQWKGMQVALYRVVSGLYKHYSEVFCFLCWYGRNPVH